MKFLSLIYFSILFSFIISSCSSLKKPGSSSFEDSKSPYVKEDVKPKIKAEQAKIAVKEERVKLLDVNNEDSKYYVIIGSFKILNNAKNYKQELEKEGFTPVLMENESGLYRVSVSANNEEMAARNRIAEIRSQFKKYSDVWLLIRKY